jgi:hypothetical protein
MSDEIEVRYGQDPAWDALYDKAVQAIDEHVQGRLGAGCLLSFAA